MRLVVPGIQIERDPLRRMTISILGRQAVFTEEGDDIDDDVEQLKIPIHAFDVIVADECHRGYGDYIEQITFLLFLKMADEKGVDVPAGCDWPTLRDKAGSDLTDFYVDLLRKLAKQTGILGDIYAEAQSRFNNPVNLKKLINLIDEIEWILVYIFS